MTFWTNQLVTTKATFAPTTELSSTTKETVVTITWLSILHSSAEVMRKQMRCTRYWQLGDGELYRRTRTVRCIRFLSNSIHTSLMLLWVNPMNLMSFLQPPHRRPRCHLRLQTAKGCIIRKKNVRWRCTPVIASTTPATPGLKV